MRTKLKAKKKELLLLPAAGDRLTDPLAQERCKCSNFRLKKKGGGGGQKRLWKQIHQGLLNTSEGLRNLPDASEAGKWSHQRLIDHLRRSL